MSRFATTQCWKCHKYPTRFLLILGKRAQKLSRKQHHPLTNPNPDVAGCCRMRSSRKTRCEDMRPWVIHFCVFFRLFWGRDPCITKIVSWRRPRVSRPYSSFRFSIRAAFILCTSTVSPATKATSHMFRECWPLFPTRKMLPRWRWAQG